jgi:hypothetical protein
VGHVAIIDGGLAMALLAIWYFCWARYNRYRAGKALRFMEAACAGKGRLVESHWSSFSRMHARLRFAPHWFENARITIRLLPRPVPLQWLYQVLTKQRETLTFEADLDAAPGFQLDLLRQRWVTHKQIRTSASTQNWSINRPGPVILTTRSEWVHDLTPVVNTVMTSKGHSLLTVRFSRESPHISAAVDLEKVSDEQAASEFLSTMRELASCASMYRHMG